MNFKTYTTEILNRYKCTNKHDTLKCIPVYDDSDNLCSFLVPITFQYEKTISGCIAYLSKWRIENPTISTGVFEVTEERTKKWLSDLVLKRPDRIIFMIKDLDDKYIGHLGFSSFNYEEKSAEIDSVLRGEKGLHPGIMTFAMRSLLNFGINELKLDSIILHVYSDNHHAVDFYKKNSFHMQKQIPLYEVKLKDEVKLEIAPDDYNGEIARYYSLMTLDKRTYNSYCEK